MLVYVVTFAAGEAISVKLTLSVERSTRNPVSLLELSVQARFTWVPDAAVAVSEVGAAGRVGVVALAMFVFADSPARL